MQYPIKSLLNSPFVNLADAIIANNTLRQGVLKAGEKQLYNELVLGDPSGRPKQVQEDKYFALRNLLYSIDKAMDDKRISSTLRKRILKNFIGKIVYQDNATRRAFSKSYGFSPPFFLLISPTKRCNRHCVGCYASSSSANAEKLDFKTFDRIMREKQELWGSFFTVLSGGEPLMWKDDGKDIIDMAAKYEDQYFLMYTNGTLINEKIAQRMAEVGNITPAISVEGFEKETDGRRGRGVHKRILSAFENLRNHGVPFGISITAMKNNAEFILSDEFMNYYFEEQGAVYGWIFQYMPIGRSYTLDLLVTPEQRKWMWEKEQYLIHEKKLFIADFWSSGPLSDGCIAAGRPGGYFHIVWNGDCSPCAFYPYTVNNIYKVYEDGGDLNTVLMSPFFQSIRRWQRKYSFMKPTHEVGNQICPCAIKDHYRNARKTIEAIGAKPLDEEAGQALNDPDYYKGLAAYGDAVHRLTQPIWEKRYIKPEKEKMGKMKAA